MFKIKKYPIRYLAVFLSLFFISTIFSQTTIFSEDFGNPPSNTSVNTFTGYQNYGTLTYTAGSSGTDVRTTTPSTGYGTASGNGNVLLNSTSKFIEIANINTSACSNFTLSMGVYKATNANTQPIIVEVSSDGITYTSLTYPSLPSGNGTTGWYYITLSGTIPSTTNLRIKITGNDGTNVVRIDDVLLVGNCTASNSITTGSVNNPPFSLDSCTAIATGTVSFTSNGTFNAGNNYIAQLSDASGSFATAVNIGTLTSSANTGVISFTIPAGTSSGNNYIIRVISDNPSVVGSNSAVFTITTTCNPTVIPGATVTPCALNGAMSIYDKCNNGQGCTSGCDLTAYSNLGYTMCDGTANNSNCFVANNPGGQQLQGLTIYIPTGCTMSVTVEFKKRGGSCTNSGMDNGDYLKINSTTYTGSGNADIIQSVVQTGGSITIEQSANRSDEILTFTASIVSGSCPSCSILDVSLIDFKCISEEKGYNLYWATANEHNSKDFEIQYSTDGIIFHTIQKVAARGESNSYTSYSQFIDNKFSSPLVYFRLKINDNNGSYTYSPIVYIQNDIFANISITPNPVSSDENVSIYMDEKTDYNNTEITLYNIAGEKIRQDKIESIHTSINTKELPAGLYQLRITNAYQTKNFRLIIQ